MRNPNLKSVNIVVDVQDHQRWKEHARNNYHGLVSQAVRAAMREAIARSQSEGGLFELRPVLERLDRIDEQLQQTSNQIEEIQEQFNEFCTINTVKAKVLHETIIKILDDGHSRTTEEISAMLPWYPFSDVRKSLEALADNFVVEPVKPTSEGNKTTWKLLGGTDVVR